MQSGTNRVMRSIDEGLTWSSDDVTGVEENGWRSVAYGDGVWVAVATFGTDNRSMRGGEARVAGSDTADSFWGTGGRSSTPSAVSISEAKPELAATGLGDNWMPLGIGSALLVALGALMVGQSIRGRSRILL